MALRMKNYYACDRSELTNEEKRSIKTIETLLTEHGAYAADFMAGIYAVCEDVFFPDGSRFSIFQPTAIAAKFEKMREMHRSLAKLAGDMIMSEVVVDGVSYRRPVRVDVFPKTK